MPQTARQSDDLYRQLINLPETVTGEIINGELHTQPRPAPPHALAASILGGELHQPFFKGRGGPGGWWIIDEPEIHLDAEVVVPDIAGWKNDRMPALPETAFFSMPPDWVCEVLSQSTVRKDRILKMPFYARHGIPHIWLVDPLARTLEAYQLEDGFWKLIGAFSESDSISAAPFTEAVIDLSLLWAV